MKLHKYPPLRFLNCEPDGGASGSHF